ncbi:hypothetical protein GRI58_12465 [Porphyrobacter algicida]|uniref:Uncharacterized protein n=1 Tax=Qipengyuania algicida TaxID=1836209 RepID=A0A845AHA5_9SPHN|nr:hypothetical protein [Qipengyuania algicida]MXP29630.1 hypothetical protein [Qipengyuania algicida]
MAAWRWINLLCGALLVAAALVVLIALTTSYATSTFEDVSLGATWFFLFALLGALCIANAAGPKDGRFGWLAAGNLLSLIILLTLLVIGREDKAAVLLIILCCIGPLSGIFAFAASRGKTC